MDKSLKVALIVIAIAAFSAYFLYVIPSAAGLVALGLALLGTAIGAVISYKAKADAQLLLILAVGLSLMFGWITILGLLLGIVLKQKA